MDGEVDDADEVVSWTGDIDWESFEAVEAYAFDETDGLLSKLLPTRIWEYLYATTTADRERLRDQRAQVANQYREALGVYQEVGQALIQQSGVTGPDTHATLRKALDELDEKGLSALVAAPSSFDSWDALRTAVEVALAQERAVLVRMDALLEPPAAAFLTTEERTQLTMARGLLAESIDRRAAGRARLAQRQETIESTLEEKVPEWEREAKWLETRAASYLDLDAYLRDDDVLADARSLATEMGDIRDSLPSLGMSTHPQMERLRGLERTNVGLIRALERSHGRYADAQLDTLLSTLDDTISDLQRHLAPARERGEQIHEADELRSTIADARTRIASFRSAPYEAQLTDARRAELEENESDLDRIAEFIERKTTFDTRLDEFVTTCEQLRADAQPYLQYERYLTSPVQTALADRITALNAAVRWLGEETSFDTLSDEDRRRFESLRGTVRATDARLTDYNATFVRRERERWADLFTDLGPSQIDLTPEQQRAVIRNGNYNQVIAAAGTGKTLALTTRVAYLILTQGVAPEDILVVTYTNEAEAEMRRRLREQFDISDVEFRTLHAFGRSILQETQDEHVQSIDAHQRENIIDNEIRHARTDENSAFLNHYYEFLVNVDDVYVDEADFETKEAYVEARAEQAYTTLKGEEVRSRAEKLIADFLFTHQVEYQYEALAPWAETAEDKGAYTPDFYLPDADNYIEHWGIDAAGTVAPWFSWSSDEYRGKIAWAREEFATNDPILVETYEFEHEAGRVKQALQHRLEAHGVELERLGFEELVDTAFDYEQREGWIKRQFSSFIENARRFDVDPETIESKLTPSNPRQYHFAQCGIHLLQQYTRYLVEHNLIDFTDMVRDAVTRIREEPGDYTQRYDHILVDEFQDLGVGQLELVQELTGPNTATLFAVGDDWQSIYSFQGADIDYFTSFDEHFGEPVRTALTTNFRSPPRIVTAGNHLIENNDHQLEKEVKAALGRNSTPQVHTLRGYNFYDYVRRVRRYTIELVQQHLDGGADPSDIMVLCRFDGAVPYLTEIKNGLRSQGIPYLGKGADQYRGSDGTADDGVSVYSLYQAKGREAKHVILVHAAEGPYGLPPQDRETDLLDPVQPRELGGLEEERRAFYVALTRTERTLDLLTRGEQKSRFLDEIDEFTTTVDAGQVEPLDDVGDSMTVTARVDKLLDPWTKQHQRGFLGDRYGGSARFVSWDSTDPPTLEEGEWYELSGLCVSEFKEEKELVMTEHSSVRLLLDGPESCDRLSL